MPSQIDGAKLRVAAVPFGHTKPVHRSQIFGLQSYRLLESLSSYIEISRSSMEPTHSDQGIHIIGLLAQCGVEYVEGFGGDACVSRSRWPTSIRKAILFGSAAISFTERSRMLQYCYLFA